MTEFFDGIACAGFLSVAVWFARGWRSSHDRLLLAFAVAFTIFAVNRVLLVATDRSDEASTLIYLLRAVGFLIIIAGVLDRNRRTE